MNAPEPSALVPPALAAAGFPDAIASDPAAMGWMTGSPTPADKTIRFADGTLYQFPQLRWSFSHYKELIPVSGVPRGGELPCVLPRRDRSAELKAVTFTPLGGSEPMTWRQSLDANYTDGIVVLHQGRIVYERYFGVLTPQRQHIAMSVTKSFFGVIAATLIDEGVLDANAAVSHHVPELADSGFGSATVRQLLDMTTALQYSENYADPQAEVWNHARAGSLLPRPPGWQGAGNFHDFLRTVRASGEHGQGFAYRTINTDTLGWVIERVTGQSLSATLSQRLWSRLGMEQDAYFSIDSAGTEFAGGGLNACLRDMARFGEMMRLGGYYNGRQVVPEAVVRGIGRGANRAHFAQAGYTLLPGWSYRDMWWVTHNEHGAYMARGVHGQAIYVDPMAQMVIARFASHPLAANANLDPTSLPAYHAMALHLLRHS